MTLFANQRCLIYVTGQFGCFGEAHRRFALIRVIIVKVLYLLIVSIFKKIAIGKKITLG